MKKIFLTALLLHLFALGMLAQNRTITFEETRVWKEIVEKAKKENKLIFVDCYTDWCGPCKLLVTNTFTKDHVADFFNENFVNAHFEMEKDIDGIANKDNWAVGAYPTLLFFDPFTEKVVHRLVGAGQPDWLVEGGKTAMDPTKNLNSLMERYNGGERSPEFITSYLKALGSGLMRNEQNKVAVDYLKDMSLDQLATGENWEVIRTNITDPFADVIRIVAANMERFSSIEGVRRGSVDMHLRGLLMDVAQSFTSAKVPFDETRYDEVLAYCKSLNIPAADPALFYLGTAGKAHNGDWSGVLADVLKVAENNEIMDRFALYHENAFIPMLGKSRDEAIVGKVIELLDTRIESPESSVYTKPRFLNMKRDLYRAIGNDVAADEAMAQAEQLNKQIQDEIDKRNNTM